jgi:hypothetical protein
MPTSGHGRISRCRPSGHQTIAHEKASNDQRPTLMLISGNAKLTAEAQFVFAIAM